MEILNFIRNLFTIGEPNGLLGMFIFTFIILTILFKDIKLIAKNLTKVLIVYSIVITLINNIVK
ncbi:UNVERIFIED_ORG: hypothetical protein B2H98_16455 [Clostridium botulinum]